MDYIRITSIDNPLFREMHDLMKEVFPPEEVLEYTLWKEPLEDPSIRVFVAVHDGKVVGATEYRYYEDFQVAMTDFTIIGYPGLAIGHFLARRRWKDLEELAANVGKPMIGMFAEIYDPYQSQDHIFGSVKPMDPYVRREVLSHLGYRRIDFSYLHPSWENNGKAVEELDLCFLPTNEETEEISAKMVAAFLRRYYAVLSNKPQAWHDMIANLDQKNTIDLLPL